LFISKVSDLGGQPPEFSQQKPLENDGTWQVMIRLPFWGLAQCSGAMLLNFQGVVIAWRIIPVDVPCLIAMVKNHDWFRFQDADNGLLSKEV